MELVLRVGGEGLATVPVSVDIEGTVAGSELVAGISKFLRIDVPAETWWWARTGRRLIEDPDVLASQPIEGDLVIVGAQPPAEFVAPPDAHVAELEVIVGPDRGATYAIGRGVTEVGRSRDADVSLTDEAVSRRHVRITVDLAGVTLEDLGSSNGTQVGGVDVRGPTPVGDGDEIRLGDSVLRWIGVDRGLTALDADVRWSDGTLQFNRPPRVIFPQPAHTFDLPPPPEVGTKRPIPWLMVLLPLVIGIPMVVLGMQSSGSPAAAIGGGAFLLMSPVMMLGNYLSDRRQGGRTTADNHTDYERRIGDLERRIARAAVDARRFRIAAAPDGGALGEWCRNRSSRLWERRSRDPDFLALHIGTADQPSLLEITVPQVGRGADEQCANRNQALADAHRIDVGVPLTVSLDEVGVLGVHGPLESAAACLRSIVLQVAALHSPGDVGIAAVVPSDQVADWDWLAWLPHCRQFAASGARTIASTDEASGLLDAVESLMQSREAALEQRGTVAVRSPRLLLLLPESDLVPAARLGRILERGPRVGIVAVASAASTAALPGECGALIALAPRNATLTLTRVGQVVHSVTPEICSVDQLQAAASALAPMRDPNADEGAGLPSSVTCADIASFDMTDPGAVSQRWSIADPELSAPIGRTAGGVTTISLRRDGPHAVVAGTTGAGKSEFLQTLIASLAAHHSPQRLAFVLIDLKGGAAFQDLARLPHTVGFFTDLDEHLAARALISLNAEVRRREEVLRAAGVKDLPDLESLGRPGTPPSLLIVFDEFAVLKSEMPDFIEGIVDIARRGRSLGVHLVLATQSPTGVVDQHIRANTNLRVALRTADAQQSQDIIERSDAASIPREARGRGWVRVGQDEPVLVQTAYSGRVGASGDAPARVVVTGFGLTGSASRPESIPTAAHGPTDATRMIDAAVTAASVTGISRGPSPWLPPLPQIVTVASLGTPPRGPGNLPVTLGIIDEPSRQTQDPHVVDLADPGNLAIFGSSGSGKTTTLRTLAAGLAATRSPADVRFMVLDFASRGLRGLGALPHTLAYVTADDNEVLDRVLARLELELAQRRDQVADIGVASYAEARSIDAMTDTPALIVLLDGLSAFVGEHEDIDFGAAVDQLARIAAEGRSVGIHVVVTIDRRAGLPMAMASAFPERLVLRMTEDDDYQWLGVPDARAVDFVVGRAMVPGGGEVQVAVFGADPSATGQQLAIEAIAQRWPGSTDRLEAVPEWVPCPTPLGDHRLVVGIDALTDGPASIDLERDPWFLVVGADRSGRSTALVTIASRWRAAHPDAPAYVVAPRRTPLTALPWTATATEVDALGPVLEQALDAARSGPVLVVIDDGDQLGESGFGSPLDALLQRSRDLPLAVIAATTSSAALRAFSGWMRDIRNPKQGLLLAPDLDRDGEVFGGRLPRRARRAFPPGRGYLVDGVDYRYVHVGVDAAPSS